MRGKATTEVEVAQVQSNHALTVPATAGDSSPITEVQGIVPGVKSGLAWVIIYLAFKCKKSLSIGFVA